MVSLLILYPPFLWNGPACSPSTIWTNFIVSVYAWYHFEYGGTRSSSVQKCQPRKQSSPRNLQGKAASSPPTRAHRPALRRQHWRWVTVDPANLCNCLLEGHGRPIHPPQGYELSFGWNVGHSFPVNEPVLCFRSGHSEPEERPSAG